VVKDLGLSTDLADESGCTALHTSVSADCPEVAQVLASELGADVEACDGDGWRALHYAAVGGQSGLVRFLVTDRQAEVAAVTENEGCLPLHYAARQGHLGVVRFLLDAMDEEDAAAMDHEGWSALTYAAAEAWEHVVRGETAGTVEIEMRAALR
jgi:ankyrin repeat protein